MSRKRVIIIGAGLAGSEAAWQVASRGYPVLLCEMRPQTMTKAHKTGNFAELVCSNSFRGASLTNAVGLLKEELKLLDSFVMEAALVHQVPAGGALAVDRELFSQYIEQKIRNHPLIEIQTGEVTSLPTASEDCAVIVATGPLTSRTLTAAIAELTGHGNLAFFDAISPIVVGDSIDQNIVFKQSRYGKGGGEDYLNVPLTEELYYTFVNEIRNAGKYRGNEAVESDMVEELRPFEGCMPIEDMVERGDDVMLFGPLKPMGLSCPQTGKRPYAVLQLRQDDKEGKLWNMVGMQTRMRTAEQKRIFRMLPGLTNAEFVRLGSVHRNTFIDSPRCLNNTLEFRGTKGLFFAGQITGTEGYVESTTGGLLAGVNAVRFLEGKDLLSLPANTAAGALFAYISNPERKDFQPMNISFGLMPEYLDSPRRNDKGQKMGKSERRTLASENALAIIAQLAKEICANGNTKAVIGV